MGRPIVQYQLAWHQQTGCEVRFRVEGAGANQWTALRVSAADLAALAAILNESPVYFTNGWIHTGPEPTGN
jgi:hypothetical protein